MRTVEAEVLHMNDVGVRELLRVFDSAVQGLSRFRVGTALLAQYLYCDIRIAVLRFLLNQIASPEAAKLTQKPESLPAVSA